MLKDEETREVKQSSLRKPIRGPHSLKRIYRPSAEQAQVASKKSEDEDEYLLR
jgi:hypothetical protein